MNRRSIVLASAVAALTASACSDRITICPADLSWKSTPDTTIAVGGQFIARLEFWGCFRTKRLEDTITFRSSDSSVALVGPVTGLVIGLRAGTATITGTGRVFGEVPIAVTVR